MRYFSYDPEDGFELHETEAEARKRADEIMEACSDYAADDGWPENMGEVCWGEVRQVAKETKRWEPEEGSNFDYMAEWKLCDVEPPRRVRRVRHVHSCDIPGCVSCGNPPDEARETCEEE